MSIEIMSRVWKHADSSLGELLVFLALADHANDEGFCWPGVEGLAKKSRLSERQTRYILRNLESKGYIRTLIQQGPRGCNMYEITLPHGGRKCPPAVCDMEGGSLQQDGGQPIAPESSGTTTEPPVITKRKGSLADCMAFCIELGLPGSDGEVFFLAKEACGWTSNGKPMKDWKATIRQWKAEGYMASQRQMKGSSNGKYEQSGKPSYKQSSLPDYSKGF